MTFMLHYNGDAYVPILALPRQNTRWVCKHKVVHVCKARFDFIHDVLLHFSASLKGKERVEAMGLLFQLLTVQFVFML